MKKYLPEISFILALIGLAGLAGGVMNGTSILIPLLMIGISIPTLRKEIKNVSDI